MLVAVDLTKDHPFDGEPFKQLGNKLGREKERKVFEALFNAPIGSPVDLPEDLTLSQGNTMLTDDVNISEALAKQVGGDHYKKLAIQPVEYILANALGFCEGNVVKLISRYKDKGKREDLDKAIHYIEILRDYYYPYTKMEWATSVPVEQVPGHEWLRRNMPVNAGKDQVTTVAKPIRLRARAITAIVKPDKPKQVIEINYHTILQLEIPAKCFLYNESTHTIGKLLDFLEKHEGTTPYPEMIIPIGSTEHTIKDFFIDPSYRKEITKFFSVYEGFSPSVWLDAFFDKVRSLSKNQDSLLVQAIKESAIPVVMKTMPDEIEEACKIANERRATSPSRRVDPLADTTIGQGKSPIVFHESKETLSGPSNEELAS